MKIIFDFEDGKNIISTAPENLVLGNTTPNTSVLQYAGLNLLTFEGVQVLPVKKESVEKIHKAAITGRKPEATRPAK